MEATFQESEFGLETLAYLTRGSRRPWRRELRNGLNRAVKNLWQAVVQDPLHFSKNWNQLIAGRFGTIKLPERQINGSSYMESGKLFESEWRSRRDNLRNFFLSPPSEMLSFLQQLREAV